MDNDHQNRIEALENEIVELWHESEAGRKPLHEYLHMTEEQYAAWAVRATPVIKSPPSAMDNDYMKLHSRLLTGSISIDPGEDTDLDTILSALAQAADAGRYKEALEDMQGNGKAAGTWLEAVEPIVARFDIAAKFEADAVHNGTGAAAIAELMRQMAARLDMAVAVSGQALQGEQS